MNFYDYRDYKKLVTEMVEAMPRRGRGQFRKLSEKLRVNSTVISQIFRGSRELSPEQALLVSEHFGFNKTQEKFFLILVQKARAGTKQLEDYYAAEEQAIREEAQAIKARLHKHDVIKDEHKAMFYSEWYYSGIRNLSAIPGYNSVDDFADYFKINRGLANHVVDFLLETGLCVEKEGAITYGPKSTLLDAKSPLINTHRRNWKLKALEHMQRNDQDDLFVTAPMSLSHKDRMAIREELVQTLTRVLKRVGDSPEEQLSCLNIDWFSF